MLMWPICLLLIAGSYGLASIAAPQTAGAAFHLIPGGILLIALCWRGFERLLWLRFPTKAEHTVAGRRCAQVLGACLLLHALLVLLGR